MIIKDLRRQGRMEGVMGEMEGGRNERSVGGVDVATGSPSGTAYRKEHC